MPPSLGGVPPSTGGALPSMGCASRPTPASVLGAALQGQPQRSRKVYAARVLAPDSSSRIESGPDTVGMRAGSELRQVQATAVRLATSTWQDAVRVASSERSLQVPEHWPLIGSQRVVQASRPTGLQPRVSRITATTSENEVTSAVTEVTPGVAAPTGTKSSVPEGAFISSTPS